MLHNKAKCCGDDYEGRDGDEPQACGDGACDLSCIKYDYQMFCTTHKTAHTSRHVEWRVVSKRVQDVEFNEFNIKEDNPVAPRLKENKVSE
jgi:hypothetical protein